MNDEKEISSLMGDQTNADEEPAIRQSASEEITAVTDLAIAEKMVEIVGVGFRTAGKTYYFSPQQFQLALGTPVIVETARGVEMGKITISNRMVSEDKIISPLRDIIRPATAADIARHEENQRLELRAAEICKQKIQSHNLEMDLVSVEYTFDNSKLLFYFTAENRVDFRDLVKDLASVFKTRIELRQIGIRDEAKLMGGFGVCGRPFCCSSFLSDFVQVSIKMAKEQNFSLNSSKISGACGRLMCCLRYEHDVYEEAIQITPAVGSYVSTPNGLGTVIETRPLAGTVKIRLEEKSESPKLYAIRDVKVLRSKGKTGLQPDENVQSVCEEDVLLEEMITEKDIKDDKRDALEKANKIQGKNQMHTKGQNRPSHKKDFSNNGHSISTEVSHKNKNRKEHFTFRQRKDNGKRDDKVEKKKSGTNTEK